jgi:membrane protein
VTQASGGGKISFGILAALWAASNGMGAVSESLNVAYDVKETRPWWKVRLTAVLLTFTLASLIIGALVLVLYGHDIAETVAGKFGLGTAFEYGWKILQWPIVLAFVLTAFAVIYFFAPDLKDHHWKWITPGAIVGVALWLIISFAFKLYLEYFNSYSATYGALGAVIILMLWFYFTGIAILVGGEINSEIEHAMAEQGDPEAKERGEKAPGEKPDAAKAGAAGASGSGGDKGGPGPGVRDTRASSVAGAARPADGRVTRLPPRRAEGRGFSFGKVLLVIGGWAVTNSSEGSPGRSREAG